MHNLSHCFSYFFSSVIFFINSFLNYINDFKNSGQGKNCKRPIVSLACFMMKEAQLEFDQNVTAELSPQLALCSGNVRVLFWGRGNSFGLGIIVAGGSGTVSGGRREEEERLVLESRSVTVEGKGCVVGVCDLQSIAWFFT